MLFPVWDHFVGKSKRGNNSCGPRDSTKFGTNNFVASLINVELHRNHCQSPISPSSAQCCSASDTSTSVSSPTPFTSKAMNKISLHSGHWGTFRVGICQEYVLTRLNNPTLIRPGKSLDYRPYIQDFRKISWWLSYPEYMRNTWKNPWRNIPCISLVKYAIFRYVFHLGLWQEYSMENQEYLWSEKSN